MTQIKYLKGKYCQKKGKVELILVKCTQSISTVLVASCNMVLNQFCIGCLCNVKKKNYGHGSFLFTGNASDRFMRYRKRYVSLPSPLTSVLFWRICLDEAQMVESTTAKVGNNYSY